MTRKQYDILFWTMGLCSLKKSPAEKTDKVHVYKGSTSFFNCQKLADEAFKSLYNGAGGTLCSFI